MGNPQGGPCDATPSNHIYNNTGAVGRPDVCGGGDFSPAGRTAAVNNNNGVRKGRGERKR